jgi:hypothetical protein
MDIELTNLINYIRSMKQDMYRKYKPEMIDEKKVISIAQGDGSEPQSKAYIKLIQKQRKMLYKNNIEAQEAAAKHDQELTQQTNKIKLTLKTDTKPESIVQPVDNHNDLCKPWNKVPNNLKIQSVLKFIDSLTPKLTDDQKNQLRFLLISSISQKKLIKQTDVEYDVVNGYIVKIYKLFYDGTQFSLTESGVFPFESQNPAVLQENKQIKKKIVLKSKQI